MERAEANHRSQVRGKKKPKHNTDCFWTMDRKRCTQSELKSTLDVTSIQKNHQLTLKLKPHTHLHKCCCRPLD